MTVLPFLTADSLMFDGPAPSLEELAASPLSIALHAYPRETQSNAIQTMAPANSARITASSKCCNRIANSYGCCWACFTNRREYPERDNRFVLCNIQSRWTARTFAVRLATITWQQAAAQGTSAVPSAFRADSIVER